MELNHQLFLKESKEFDKTLNCDWPLGPKSREYFQSRIDGEGVCCVCEENGKILGYFAGGLTGREDYRLDFGQIAELENIFVLDNYRSQGLGQKMLDFLFDWCQKKSVARVKVIASVQNLKGIDFYEKNGFQKYNIVLEKVI